MHEQLALLPNADLPLQQRLDTRTRTVGLAGIAHARRTLEAARQARLDRERAAARARALEHRPARTPPVPQIHPPRAA